MAKTSKPTAGDASAGSLPSKDEILAYLKTHPGESDKRQLARAFKLRGAQRVALRDLLREMKRDGSIEDKGRRRLSAAGHLPAVAVLRERYLLCDDQGRPTESTGEMMDRAARFVADAEDEYGRGTSARWAERFSALLRNLEFLPNSPTLMNAGTEIGLLAGCFVLPVEDSLHSIFTTLGQAAEIQRTGAPGQQQKRRHACGDQDRLPSIP